MILLLLRLLLYSYYYYYCYYYYSYHTFVDNRASYDESMGSLLPAATELLVGKYHIALPKDKG